MKTMKRACSLLAVVAVAMGQGVSAQDQKMVHVQIVLWPEGAPGAQGSADTDNPTLTVYLPAKPNATKTGVVVAPGGGYQHLAMDHEGAAIARWLNDQGVAAFVLKYRLGPAYHHPVELGDAQRAIRMVRANAEEYGVALDRVGMWGFSAGGHLTAMAGTRFDAGKPAATDLVERQGCRPDFLILAYPVITFQEPYLHGGSKKYLLGDSPNPALVNELSAEMQVTKATPPAFLFATEDDPVVLVMNSLLFYEALVKAGVPAEIHLFPHGPHGVGLAPAMPALRGWPDLLLAWMQGRGYAAVPAP